MKRQKEELGGNLYIYISNCVQLCACVSQKLVSPLLRNEEFPIENNVLLQDNNIYAND
jgi:hypothetical protein